MPSEGIEGDEWGAYVTLSRIAGTNAGSPTGREPYGDTGPVVVAGVTTCQGGRTSADGSRASSGPVIPDRMTACLDVSSVDRVTLSDRECRWSFPRR